MNEQDFNDRMERAFDPYNRRSLIEPADINIGGQRDELLKQAVLDVLGDLDNFDENTLSRFSRGLTEAEAEAEREEYPATRVVPDYISRYDRQFIRRVALEKEIADLDDTSPRYHEAMADLAVVKSKIKVELENSTDDEYRERERIDEWKATTGKDERNASRRDRPEANIMTPKAVLAAETPDEKKDRIRERDTELKRLKRANKKTL